MIETQVKINKGGISWWTLRIFYIVENNQLVSTNVNKKPEPLPLPSSILWGKQNCISGFDFANKQFSIPHRDNYQDQLTMIQSTQTSKSKFNNDKVETKNPKEATF